MTDLSNTEDAQRLATFCGLAATRPCEPAEECPPDTVMAAFLEHRLDKREKQKMLAHLNRCEDCYRLWMETATLLHEEAAEPAVTPASQTKKKRPSLWEKMRGWLPASPILAPALTAAALTVAVVAVLINHPGDNFEPSVLVAMVENHPGAEKLAAALPQPWESGALAFDSENYSAPERAVAAGIWETKHRLANGRAPLPAILEGDVEHWQKGDLKPYYQLGQWLATAWISAQNSASSTQDWQNLLQTARTLEKQLADLNGNEATDARRLLTQLRPILQHLANEPAPQIRARFARQVRIAMERIFV